MIHGTPLPLRRLGKTGFNVSIVGFGGLMLSGMPQDQADEVVNEAVESGVNYFDVAPTYGDAQAKLAPFS